MLAIPSRAPPAFPPRVLRLPSPLACSACLPPSRASPAFPPRVPCVPPWPALQPSTLNLHQPRVLTKDEPRDAAQHRPPLAPPACVLTEDEPRDAAQHRPPLPRPPVCSPRMSAAMRCSTAPTSSHGSRTTPRRCSSAPPPSTPGGGGRHATRALERLSQSDAHQTAARSSIATGSAGGASLTPPPMRWCQSGRHGTMEFAASTTVGATCGCRVQVWRPARSAGAATSQSAGVPSRWSEMLAAASEMLAAVRKLLLDEA
eukprot:350975-Chlamydomonas_euryale.AAC.11